MATLYPIPEGTPCSYCSDLAYGQNGQGILFCEYHGQMWGELLSKLQDRGWIELAMLTAVAEDNGHD